MRGFGLVSMILACGISLAETPLCGQSPSLSGVPISARQGLPIPRKPARGLPGPGESRSGPARRDLGPGIRVVPTPAPRPATKKTPTASNTLPRPAVPPASDENDENDQFEDGDQAEGEHEGEEADDEAEEESEEEEPELPPGLLGYALHGNEAITGEYIYTGEVFTNTRGGLNTQDATRYRGNLDLVLTADSEKLGLWRGGQFFLYGMNTHGRTLTAEDVGDYQFYSNIDTSPRPADVMQVNEYWVLQQWGDGLLTCKVGKQDANADFAFADLGGDFVNSSFGLVPTVPLPTYPNPGLGVAGFVLLTDGLRLLTGIYDGGPDGGQWGFNTLGEFGAISLYQLEWHPQFGSDGLFPGTYRVCAWYHSHDFEEVGTDTPRTLSGNHGFWATADQMIWKESLDGADEQGIGVFGQFGWAPDDRNAVDCYYGGGLVYRGWLDGRDDDICGVGMANVLYGSRVTAFDGSTHETVVECFYKAMLSPYVSLQPDLQYIATPSGMQRDALVAGTRFEVVF